MKTPGRLPGRSCQNRLFKLLTTEFHDPHQAYQIFYEFLRQKTFNKNLCLTLLAVAKQKSGAARWDVRRLAMLMLENQILKIPTNNLAAFDHLLTELNLKSAPGYKKAIAKSVLKEGYSTTDLPDFVPQFRRRLERLNYAHEKIKGRRTSDAALRDFIDLSRHDCKLSLARYLFTPAEVADQILGQLQLTDGVKDVNRHQPAFVDDEIAQGLSRLPEFEAGIVKRLCESSDIYWVTENTRSEINSLVEYPLTTVVVVIKPPGSDIEFEIKRVGRKGDNPLNVIFARNGDTVSPEHRFDGGSMQWLLRFEATAASRLSRIFRCVHGAEAPVPNYISRSAIYSIPVKKARVQSLRYFTEPHLFGRGFQKMRVAMRESVDAFIEEGGSSLPELPGDLGLTAQFISQVAPAQAILSGTTAFRLDKLAAYLSTAGPQLYFGEGLSIAYSTADQRRLADTILEEILGSYRPPKVRFQSYEQYVEKAFAETENRIRADEVYLSVMNQIARFWGTLLSVRGYSRGESFVARNVGLKSFWDAGQWQVKIIFMDHDSLAIPGEGNKNFLAQNVLPEMALDERYIWGGATAAQFATSEVGYLQNIYRVSEALAGKGRAVANRTLRNAYQKTRRELLASPGLRALFNEQFLRRLADWDSFVSGYLQLNGDRAATSRWKKQMKKTLTAKGYRPEAFDSYEKAILKNRQFLERYRRLFTVETKK